MNVYRRAGSDLLSGERRTAVARFFTPRLALGWRMARETKNVNEPGACDVTRHLMFL